MRIVLFEQLTNSIQTNITVLHNLIDSMYTTCITNNDVDLNTGLEQFPDVLYKTTHTIVGTTITLKPGNRRKQERKYKSSWFANECESARREFKQANLSNNN